MNKPLVSVITVCYNGGMDLDKTILSVLNQSFDNMEYIIVDGASSDNTAQILKKYEQEFKKAGKSFSYISEKDNGVYDAMNKGADLATGEWINFLNAGDSFYHEEVLKTLFSKKIPENAGVIYGNTLEEYAFGERFITEDSMNESNRVMPFCHQSSFVRSKLMREFRFDLQYKIVADHDLFYRLRKNNINFEHYPIVVARYNGQYGISATHPLELNLERLRIYGLHKKWYYPFAYGWTCLRQGFVQPLKVILPERTVHRIMKRRRKNTGQGYAFSNQHNNTSGIKVKIMTTYDVYNYGASLQAYALMSYLLSKGYDVRLINYKPKYLTQRYNYRWVNPESILHKYVITRFIYRILKYTQRQFTLARKKAFDKFTREYIISSPVLYKTFEELRKNPPLANVFIVGSDQVWNSFYDTGKDPAFYLAFVPKDKKRISYAASFAITKIDEKLKPTIRQYLTDFNAIAVREHHALTILNDMQLSGTWVLDPVFLLSEERWKELMVPFEKKEKYILVYDFERNKEIRDFALQLSYEKKIKIYSIVDNYPLWYANKNYNGAGPKEFITLIYHCDYFISNSFHGSTFSIIFQKDFFIFDRNRHKVNSRMESLLTMFELQNRYIHNDTDYNDIMNQSIDYSKVKPLLEKYLKISVDYLDDALN